MHKVFALASDFRSVGLNKVYEPQPKIAPAITTPLWVAGITVIARLKAGERDERALTPLRRLITDIREKCGASVANYRAKVGPNARDIFSRALTAVFQSSRKKVVSDEEARRFLLKVAFELERLVENEPFKDEHLYDRLEDFCTQVYTVTKAVRPAPRFVSQAAD